MLGVDRKLVWLLPEFALDDIFVQVSNPLSKKFIHCGYFLRFVRNGGGDGIPRVAIAF